MPGFFRAKIKKKKVREPHAQKIIDALRKMIITVLVVSFALFSLYAALNFWTVVTDLNEFIVELGRNLGFGMIFLF